MAAPVARFDNGVLWSDTVSSEPVRSFATAAEAEGAARRLAAGDRDAVVRFDGERYHVDSMAEVADRPTSMVRSNELIGARRDVTAFFTGRGQSVGLRTTRDASTAVERVADVLTRAGIPATEARTLAMSGISRDQAQSLLDRILRADRPMNDFGPRMLSAELLATAYRNPGGLSALELAGQSQRYAPLRVVRPDGYVARMDTGEPIYRAGELRVQDGRVRAGNYEIGQMLMDSGGVYREVDANLRPGRIVGERPIEQAFPVLSGATDAVALAIYGTVQAVMNPREALTALANAPARVAAGIRDLPQTVETFSQMSSYDRALAVGRLGGTVVTTATGVGAIRTAFTRGATQLAGTELGGLTLNVSPSMFGLPSPVLALAGGGARVVPHAVPLQVGALATQAIAKPLAITAASAWAAENTSLMLGPETAPHQPEVDPEVRGARQAQLDQTFGSRRRAPEPAVEAANDPRLGSNPSRGRFDAAFDGPTGYTRALERARMEAGDLGANRQVLRDPQTGTIIGERSADGARGWRIDADHANWWDFSTGNKGTGGRFGHSFFPGEQAGPHSLSREYSIWQSLP